MMLRFQTVVVTADPALRQALRRLATAIGAVVECIDPQAALPEGRQVDLLVCDARGGPPAAASAAASRATSTLYLVDGARLQEYLPLLQQPGAAGLLAAEGGLDEDVFIATATKALRGEIFGLEKYFPWGVTTFAIDVRGYEEKERALEILLEHATLAGCRWALRERIQLAGDELLMNALYHGPVDQDGARLHEGKTVKELAHLPHGEPVVLRYGCSGRHFGLSILDIYGSLSRGRLLEYLSRVRSEGTASGASPSMESKPTGAGLGLASVMRSASRLIFNLQEGQATEVIALFDREALGHGRQGAQSVCLFEAAPDPGDPQEEDPTLEEEGPQRPGGSWTRTRFAAALLLSGLLAGLGGVYAAHRIHTHGQSTELLKGRR